MRQKEPTDKQVAAIMEAIDEDENGSVSRMEWVSYCTISDKKTGIISFNAQMRHLFEDCDVDGSGSITSDGINNKRYIPNYHSF